MRILFILTIFIVCSVCSPFALAVNTPCGTVADINTSLNVISTGGVPSTGETPQSISCAYGFIKGDKGCTIEGTKRIVLNTGGSGVIAVTEGYDDPFALQELNEFSTKFHLPLMSQCADLTTPSSTPCFATVYATGTAPAPAYGLGPGGSDDLLREHALDIEMAHAMAPQASIIMVEAPDFSQFSSPSIFSAVQCATQIVQAMGGGLVSNSWSTAKSGVHEYANETSNDSYFQGQGVVYVSSSGDTLAPANYPAVSSYVIGVGGTAFVRDSKGNFVNEVVWTGTSSDGSPSGSSGGPSIYIPRPSFQNFIMKILGSHRGSPDVSTIGHNIDMFYYSCPSYSSSAPTNNCTGVYDAGSGTSFASPLMAGIINKAGSHAQTTQEELTLIYNNAQKNYHAYWHDIIQGSNGYPAMQGYDFTTGLGTPRGYGGK